MKKGNTVRNLLPTSFISCSACISAAPRVCEIWELAQESGNGGECRIADPGIETVRVRNSNGAVIKTRSDKKGRIKFTASKGETDTVTF